MVPNLVKTLFICSEKLRPIELDENLILKMKIVYVVITPNVSNLALTLNIFLEVGTEVQCSSHALETLTFFRPKFNLCRNNVAGFY